MKNVSLTVASVLLAGILTAQEYTPTSSMTSAFSAKYPQGLVEEWYDNDDEIICYFGNGDTYGTAYFTLKGAWTRSEFTLSEDELPKTISSSIGTNYANFEITNVIKIESAKTTLYTIYAFNSDTGSDYMLTIDKAGEIIEEEDLSDEE
ncbi:MAG: hypothetical protein ACI8XB_001787 [Patiriisocius sp.]|jgi:hypothetical protein